MRHKVGLYLNGQPVASLTVATPSGLPVNWSNSVPTLFSVQTNSATLNGEFDVSSIQFHAVALSSQTIAGIGSPATGPMPGNDPSVGPEPALEVTQSNGSVSFTWSGNSYVLEETTDLTTGDWTDSALPFTEAEVNGNIATTAVATPSPGDSGKFYRLIFRP